MDRPVVVVDISADWLRGFQLTGGPGFEKLISGRWGFRVPSSVRLVKFFARLKTKISPGATVIVLLPNLRQSQTGGYKFSLQNFGEERIFDPAMSLPNHEDVRVFERALALAAGSRVQPPVGLFDIGSKGLTVVIRKKADAKHLAVLSPQHEFSGWGLPLSMREALTEGYSKDEHFCTYARLLCKEWEERLRGHLDFEGDETKWHMFQLTVLASMLQTFNREHPGVTNFVVQGRPRGGAAVTDMLFGEHAQPHLLALQDLLRKGLPHPLRGNGSTWRIGCEPTEWHQYARGGLVLAGIEV